MLNSQSLNKRSPLIIPAVTVAIALLAGARPSTAQRRVTTNFDLGWRFHLGHLPHAEDPSLTDSTWRTLDLPHDWSIEGDFSAQNPAGAGGGALPGGIGWYRKTFTIPAADSSRLVFVDFEGVYRNSEVWINGHYLGKRPYGYSSFRYELTPHLRYGSSPNLIAVRVDNSQQPNSRWYSGSGIYRHTRLVMTGKVHVDHWGTYVTTPVVTAESATVEIRTSVRNALPNDTSVRLVTTVYDPAGKEPPIIVTSPVRLTRDSVGTVRQRFTIRRPRRWSLEHPSLPRRLDHRLWSYGLRRRLHDAVRRPQLRLPRRQRLLPQRPTRQDSRRLPPPRPRLVRQCRQRPRARAAARGHAGDGRQRDQDVP